MRSFVPSLRTRLMVRAAAIALVSGSVAACSSDSSRFGESPFSNPFSSASNDAPAPRKQRDDYATGSVQAAPTSRIERAPLGAPSAAQSQPMYGYGGEQGARSGGSYRTSRVEPAAASPAPVASNEGGTTVTVRRGETLTVLSSRYGVPAAAILQANNLQNANGVTEGSRIVIPTYSGNGSYQGQRVASAAPLRPAAPVVSPVAPRQQIAAAPAAPAMAGKPKMQFVQGPQAKGAETKGVEVKTAAAKPVEPKQEQAFAAQPAKPSAPQPAADQGDNVKTAALKVEPTPSQSAADSGPSFRWPARGRVISGYGSKTSGASNDGVNIAVPEGTEIKAADDGVVAYSGSELKGFGNLVLIRHPNGWVTAYAHNSALNVKRGDTVRRGQIIAKSGSTGNVASPQLHFEVRKGAQTVDPLKHLPDV